MTYIHTTKKGYRRVRVSTNPVRYKMEHVLIWEAANGPVPEGHCLHHVNHDPSDNRLENLQCVDAQTHKRLHTGCELRDGEWWKRCAKCDTWLPLTVSWWYFDREERCVHYGMCRECFKDYVRAGKARRAGKPVPTEPRRRTVKLDLDKARQIRAEYASLPRAKDGRAPLGTRQRFAERYGVSAGTISAVIGGVIWKEPARAEAIEATGGLGVEHRQASLFEAHTEISLEKERPV